MTGPELRHKRCEVCRVTRNLGEFPSYLLIPLWYSAAMLSVTTTTTKGITMPKGISEKHRNLLERRAAYWQAMSAVIDKMDKGERLTSADKADFDQAEIGMKFVESELRCEGIDPAVEFRSGASADDVAAADGRSMRRGGVTEEDRAFTRYLRTGDARGLNEVRVSAGFTTSPIESGQTDTGNAGYQVPQGFWANMQVALKAYGGIANDFKLVETDNGRPMPWPTIDPTAVTAGIIGLELTQLAVANPYVFGQGILNAWTYATNLVLASIQLV